ncbi:TraR/DksA family transcriptional regulator [Aureibacter tunicatorum]|uniref:RNA polymerase-binding transcription factor DksA n=1 Tax=Aureibacter tunicatorum TaxID=866807 RepID=A0AAE3XRP6_9BACT|nr:TraR/DksA C4-type zinc finger protein [Aureibacter tunicatorum]MDR6240229.1 RNA polymerase-binding transcription factor DksA [Aureibacter tunicatorum]BDD05890.1 molecular chaperone DnaK [Aureibacter tunicatorum]
MENTIEKKRYSDEELKEFEVIIREKIEKARKEVDFIKASLTKSTLGDINGSYGNVKVLEDGADTAEKESLNQLAARQQKFITNLQNALVRIKNKTYGVCKDTGELIPKERLKAVPHTMQTVEAKMKRR